MNIWKIVGRVLHRCKPHLDIPLVTKGRLPEMHFGTVCPKCGVNIYCNRHGTYLTKRLNVAMIPSTLKLIDRSTP